MVTIIRKNELFRLANLELLQYDEDFLTKFVNSDFLCPVSRYNILCRMYKNAVEVMPDDNGYSNGINAHKYFLSKIQNT